jgi:hypothetical protein
MLLQEPHDVTSQKTAFFLIYYLYKLHGSNQIWPNQKMTKFSFDIFSSREYRSWKFSRNIGTEFIYIEARISMNAGITTGAHKQVHALRYQRLLPDGSGIGCPVTRNKKKAGLWSPSLSTLKELVVHDRRVDNRRKGEINHVENEAVISLVSSEMENGS